MDIIENLQYEIEQEVESQVKSIKEQYINQKKLTNTVKKELQELKEQYAEKRKDLILDKYSKNITLENAHKFLELFFTPTHTISGMDTSNEAKNWFCILVKYYDNKDEVIDILECFNIPNFNSSWAKSFRMPYDWDKEELTEFFTKGAPMCKTNGCYLDSNIGFWRRVAVGRTPSEQIKSGLSFSGIPLQFILQNKLLSSDEKLFNLLISGSSADSIYYLNIAEQQRLPEKQNTAIIKEVLKLKDSGFKYRHITPTIKACLKNITQEDILDEVFNEERIKVNISYFPDFYKKKVYTNKEMDESHIITIKQNRQLFTKEEYEVLLNKYVTFLLR